MTPLADVIYQRVKTMPHYAVLFNFWNLNKLIPCLTQRTMPIYWLLFKIYPKGIAMPPTLIGNFKHYVMNGGLLELVFRCVCYHLFD